MLNTSGMFRIVPRPEGVTSHYTLMVVDGDGRPHLPLTRFYDKALQGLSDGAARTYLNVLLPYFQYLATNEWRQHRGDRWDSPPDAVQQSVRDYLVEHLACKVQWRETYERVCLTARSPSTVHVFLSALKLFYSAMRWIQSYSYPHPLLDPVAHVLREVEQEERLSDRRRPMPQVSGVEEPRPQRTSENYFRLVNGDWIAQPIDDSALSARLIAGFERARLCLRDRIVIRVAYESGARISEILGLTVGDWRKRGGKQEATAFSKGSRGRRVKTIRFHMTTAKMLRQYANTERAALDQKSRRFDELDDSDPLFLSQRRKPYSYAAFKPHWYKLCDVIGIDLNIHGLRHWYVTQELLLVSSQAKSPGELKLRQEELVRYMAWRSPSTLQAYEHIVNDARHATTQDQLHQKWYEDDLRYEQENTSLPSLQSVEPIPRSEAVMKIDELHWPGLPESGWETLLALGGTKDA